jgi:hypothetical protein
MSGYMSMPVSVCDAWVRIGDLTDEMANYITGAQRRAAARQGELRQFDRDYAARMRQLDQDERLYGNR